MESFVEFLTSTPGWITIAVVLTLLLAGLGVGITRAKRRELPKVEPKPQLPSTPRGDYAERDERDQLSELTRPEVAEPSADTLPAPSTRPQVGEPDRAEGEEDGDAVASPDSTPEEEPEPSEKLDEPESAPSRMKRLRSRLAGSGQIGSALLSILSQGELSEADWEDLEDTLLMADLGLDAAEEVMNNLRTQVKVHNTTDPDKVRELLRDELLKVVDPHMDRSLNLEAVDTETGRHPAVVLMVGVNGTGKTTTVGKLARLLVSEDKSVLLGAADTFRAAAAEQLTTWGNRVGVKTVASDQEGADPASVAFDAVKQGREDGADVVLVDTAGRLQNKSTLMDELGKVKRVMEKQGSISETLLVLDATTGQNGMRQAEVFAQVVDVTGVVLTKLDGSAKGGIVVSVQRQLGVPVKLVGLGEGVDDLAPFSPQDFVNAIVG